MNDHRDTDVHELRKRLANAEYEVDPGAVADAIVRRRWIVAVAGEAAPVFPIDLPRARARVRCVRGSGVRVAPRALAA